MYTKGTSSKITLNSVISTGSTAKNGGIIED